VIDWGIGRYEETASELAPVAEHVVSLARLQAGERAVDLACGTGNAALLAARAGATVSGVDAAARLVEVARERAAGDGLQIDLAVAKLEALPYDARSFDAALSVFGLIFASDVERAFAEMLRVLAPGGRALISVWVPAGAIDAMIGVLGRAVAAATGSTPKRFAWHDPQAVGELAARHGAELEVHDGELTISAGAPEEYFARQQESHPMSVAGRPLLEQAGTYRAAREQALAALREGNEDPQAFRVTSPYRIYEIRR
jgi:SAM-dependent methyltransferase